MSTIVIAASPGTYLASLGAMVDAHARLGEVFVTNPALGDYAEMKTRLVLVSTEAGRIELADGYHLEADDRLANIREARIVYLPSFQAPDPAHAMNLVAQALPLHGWLGRQRDTGALIAACGASVLHLIAAGLLDGAQCSAPARLQPLIAAKFPAVSGLRSEAVVEHDGLFTSARDADNAALVLHLLARAFSPAVAQSLAQRERPAGIDQLVTDPVVARAQWWIRDHFASSFSIADLAGRLGTSHQSLIRRFREAGQGTPKAYAQRLRIEAAAISMIETDRSVAEIAQLVGYTDIPSFRKIFTARMGSTPGAWRRQARRGALTGPIQLAH